MRISFAGFLILLALASQGEYVSSSASASSAKSSPNASSEQKAWTQKLREGVEALDNNQYWIAEPSLKEAAVEAARFGEKDLRLAKSLSELGRLYTVRGRFEDAEPLLEEELYIKQQVLEEEGAELVPAMASMIKFYLNHGTKNKAETLSNEMLEIVEGKLREAGNKPKTKVSKVNGTITLEAWAGVAAQAVRDPFIEWAISCDSVADVYFSQHNFEMAERMYRAALEVKETVLGKTHLSLANSYDSLGTLELARGDSMRAESDLKDAFEMTSKILPKSNPQVFARLDKLAKAYLQSGKRSQARELYLSSQNFWAGLKTKTAEPIRASLALANIYLEEKNYAAAEPLLKAALASAEEFHGESSDSLIPYLQRYAYVLYHLGRKSESDQLKARAQTIAGPIMVAENAR